jgi:AcrR family transcriptional regulator
METDSSPLKILQRSEATAIPERADAARNRVRVLEAARELVDRDGLDRVTMDDIARAAGVGKGTVYRRFGDKSGLALALLDEHERRLQEQIVRGAPPLGPGAKPAERLQAFFDAYVVLLVTHEDVARVAETAAPGARYRSGVYAAWQTHVRMLLAEARPEVDAEIAADLLLGMVDADLIHHLRSGRGFSLERIRASLASLV